MNYRELGNKGFEISEVGLGCWQLGSDWGTEIDKQTAFEILGTAIDNGITFFDTADVYGGGRSEELIGEFLKSTKAAIRVGTKFGRTSDVYPDNYTEQKLRACVDASRKRLDTDRIDLLQLHCIPTAELKKEVIFDWLRKLKNEGTIAHFGASVESEEQGLLCLEQEGIQSLQVIYNIFRQKLTTKLLPSAKAKGVGIIARLPLASGLLTGKFDRTSKFPENDHRNYNKDGKQFNVGETFAGLPFTKGVELSDELSKIAPLDISLTEMSLRWILDHDAITTIIPGASSPNHIADNAKISSLTSLPKELMQTLEDFYNARVKDSIRGVY